MRPCSQVDGSHAATHMVMPWHVTGALAPAASLAAADAELLAEAEAELQLGLVGCRCLIVSHAHLACSSREVCRLGRSIMPMRRTLLRQNAC